MLYFHCETNLILIAANRNILFFALFSYAFFEFSKNANSTKVCVWSIHAVLSLFRDNSEFAFFVR